MININFFIAICLTFIFQAEAHLKCVPVSQSKPLKCKYDKLGAILWSDDNICPSINAACKKGWNLVQNRINSKILCCCSDKYPANCDPIKCDPGKHWAGQPFCSCVEGCKVVGLFLRIVFFLLLLNTFYQHRGL
jgi:hypothetical protein